MTDQSGSSYWKRPAGRQTMNSRGDLGLQPQPAGGQTEEQPQQSLGDQPAPAIIVTPSQNDETSTVYTSAQDLRSSSSAPPDPDPLRHWRVDISGNSPPDRSTTPHDQPEQFSHRRSPPMGVNCTTDAENVDEVVSGACGGEGSTNATNALNTTDIEPQNIPTDLNEDQLSVLIATLDTKIEIFGADFRNREGWRGLLQQKTEKLRNSVDALIINAKRLNARPKLAKLYDLRKALGEHTQNLSELARIEAQAQGSPFIFRPSSLNTPAGPPNATLHQSMDNLGRDEVAVGRDSVSDNENDRTHNSRVPIGQLLRTLEMKIKSLEVRKADIQVQESLITALDTKASKREVSDACLRICQLESATEIGELQMNLFELQQIVNDDKAETGSLIDGLVDDLSTVETKLEQATNLIRNLQAEVDEMRNQGRQSRQSSHDRTSHIRLPGNTRNQAGIQLTQQPAISGISVYPTSTQNSMRTTANQGYTYTPFTMIGGTRPTSVIAPSAFPTSTVSGHLGPVSGTVHVPTSVNPNLAPSGPVVPQPSGNTHRNQRVVQHDHYQRTRQQPPASTAQSRRNQTVQVDDDDSDSVHSLDSDRAQSERSSITEDYLLSQSEYVMKSSKRALLKMLVPPINDKLTKTVVQGVLKSIVPAVDTERKELQTLISRYARDNPTDYGRRVIDKCQKAVEDARDWAIGMRSKYNELDCAKLPLDAKLFEGLKKFSDSSNTNIFEFLSRFEAFTEEKGTPKEKAALLYESYLHTDIQVSLIEHKESYPKMREWLIHRYGNVKVMTENILRVMNREQVPSDLNISPALTNYYKKLNSVMKRIKELMKTKDMPLVLLQNHIYSNSFIERLVAWLPEKARLQFFQTQNKQDLYIQGSDAFNTVVDIVATQFSLNETATRMDSNVDNQKKKSQPQEDTNPKKKGRGAHAAARRQDSSSDEEAERSAHFQKPERKNPKQKETNQNSGTKNKGNQKPKTDAQKKKFDFPCPLHENHELGSCKEFFSMNPSGRYRAIFRKNCVRCLGPSLQCRGACKQTRMPKILMCPECLDWGEQNNRRASNVLVCTRKEHSRPLEKDLLEPMKKYFTGFSPKEVQGNISLSAHLRLSAHGAKANKETLTSEPDDDLDIPVIDTHSGEVVDISENNIISESKQDAFYIMQILNLRGQDVLTFYDSGANYHLIDGNLAEDISLKVLKKDGVNIQVVGGKKVWSNYGTYGLTLGPSEDNYYHQLSAQGLGVISGAFEHYDLQEINQEVRKSKSLPKGYGTLPKYIGGQEPKLLLGIKDTGLQPELLFQLPSGLGVYRSQLKDKFGSRICYGGPHEAFTKVNKSNGSHFHQIDAFFLKMSTQLQNSPYSRIARALEPDYEDTGYGVMMADHSKVRKTFITNNDMITKSSITDQDLAEIEGETFDEDLEEIFCAGEPVNDLPLTLKDMSSKVQVHKARVPISKRKEYIDEDDQRSASSYRCEDCTKCKKCSLSDKTKMMSLQEKMEQEAIEKSVHINLKERKVFVDLPFIKPPIDALKKRHNADSNYRQALKIYQSQCKKPHVLKQAMVKVHEDLVQRGFMVKFSDLTSEQQNLINTAGFKHYMPWNIAEKPESQSTPVRMVVDASVTGLNEILAKGENKMSKINNILIRNRCRRFIWTSDISKLYNQLHLNDSALPYTLFLFNSTLSTTEQPQIYVMTRAWYGVSPTGNQSTEALVRLTNMLKEEYPLAAPIVKQDLYVDDTITGSNDEKTVMSQIKETLDAFSQGGFKLKYVVRSGEDPCEEASSDGTALKILGYKWSPRKDILNPGFTEVNFNKKRRGAKKPNPFLVETEEDVSRLLDSKNITRRLVVSKIAEIWDPIGIWEPYKLQLKLDNSYLNGNDWDTPLNCNLQTHWKERFQQFVNLNRMEAVRCVIPEDAIDPNSMRLLCLSDAAEFAGGCAIYASFQRTNGSFSCQLLTAKSKLMNQKIPRNELEAIKLMAETADTVKRALGEQVHETLYFTDSTIAMCWCHNTSKKLRLFTLYRVADIRRNILGSAYASEEPPLYHIDGKINVADYLTKHHDITPRDLSSNSVWLSGQPWMRLPLNEMPITTYKQLTISKAEMSIIDQECFPEPIMSEVNCPKDPLVLYNGINTLMHCTGCDISNDCSPFQTCYGITEEFDHCDECTCPIQFSSFALNANKEQQGLVSIIELGWTKSISRLTNIVKYVHKSKHQVHLRKGILFEEQCVICRTLTISDDSIELDKVFAILANNYLFQQETARIKMILPPQKIKQFSEKNGILYYESRLSEENQFTQSDLDVNVFTDGHEINTMLPVVLADSELFFAYTVHIHHKVQPHSGVEVTLKEIMKTMMVLNNPRRVIQRIRKHCPRCRIIAKKTLELRMMHHPAARTHLAPPFYHCQVDTVFGFKGQPYKNARKSFKMYALVIVCLLTGATSILAIEGLETQDVIQAIERHSSRHGVPAAMYVDNGTQLMALEHVNFNLRDLQTHVSDSLGLKIIVSNAKSHEERGRVEAKVKILRDMLDKLAINTQSPMTGLQWETLFSKISNTVDNLPIAKCTNSNLTDPVWDIITANRLKLGRNNNRSLEGFIALPTGVGPDTLLKRNQQIQKVWYQLFMDRIHHLIPRPKKWSKTDDVNVGDICLFIYLDNTAIGNNTWKIGRVIDIIKKNKILIEYPATPTTKRTVTRCPRDISIISAAGDVDLNSRKFYEQIHTQKETEGNAKTGPIKGSP